MRLKHLKLQGYKSFATLSEFLFDSGITAIVGPNGSGKSNIADAIRWVLGEQSYSTLRGKRTEDMIFSGSTQRARLGMAQVSITLDNSDHRLPIDYNEVMIERRAYRSGENEYWVNGSRVRLKDMNDLLAAAGLSRRTYAVIGQGLVDAALSLRPEERRLLFEEAAGITAHQSKRADAVNRLRETTQNIIRVNDIVNEIRPQLGRLQKQAEQAQDYQRINRELRGLLLEWYGYRWYQAQQTLATARSSAKTQEQQIKLRQTELDTLERRSTDNRSRQNELRQQIGEWHRQSSQLHSLSESIQRELAVHQERQRLIEGQHEEVLREMVPLQASRLGQAERLQEAETGLVRLETEMGQQKTQLMAFESQMSALHAQRKALLSERTTAQNKAFHLSTQISDARNRVTQLGERRAEISKEQQTHQHTIDGHAARITDLSRELSGLQGEVVAVDRQIADAQMDRSRGEEAMAQRQAERAALQSQLNQVRQELGRLQTRYEMLARLHEEMTNYYEGVRAVLGASAKRQVPGLLGTVASLVQVDTALEKAVEVALGNHLQDIVAESWDSAQRAIEFLKKNRAGRATFLPIDNLRPTPALRPPNQAGVIGLALDLVKFDVPLRPVFELLLGHTLIVEGLDVAHRVFKDLRGGFQIVTRDGEIVRSTGAVSGGTTRNQPQGLLSREREWRELPAQIAAASERCTGLEKEMQRVDGLVKELLGQIEAGDQKQGQLRQRREQWASRTAQLKQDIARLAQEVEWRRAIISQFEGERKALDVKEHELTAAQERLRAEVAELESRLAEIGQQLVTVDSDPVQEEMGHLRTQVAVTEQAIDNQRVILENHQRALQELDQQISAKGQRAEELSAETDVLTSEVAGLSVRAGQLSKDITELMAHIGPAEAELASTEQTLNEIGQMEVTLRNRLRTLESLQAQAGLEVQRRRDELENLHRQMEEDLGLVETEIIETTETQQPLPLKPLVERLPTLTQLPLGLDEEIRRLKNQRQRLGTVNPNAPSEYAELLERYTFLTNQAEDLQKAASSLQAVIAELDQLIAGDFSKTFRAIAAEFKDYFSILFGGGSARLVLTDPDNPLTTGIEIMAKPPGKRHQSLNLLSGGERALTAAALIFSILKISPTPFCVLDEVDAMLDEANVGRFRETLSSLAEETQFILITHNRRTVEAAQTLYGVSMGDDNTSVVISLKLDDDHAGPQPQSFSSH